MSYSAAEIYSIHINCGGEVVNINNTIQYEADTERRGASSFYSNGKWAFSSTGNFIYGVHDADVYIISNTSSLHHISSSDTELYTRARTAAISLTYYGLCLMNGKYTVKLHFAEIVFTQDKSYASLGKRVFDVYVQGELKLKDFDIAKEAGGIGRALIKTYEIDVRNNTLKIQLYWAGKGTQGLPDTGIYGPIISAISVNPNFKLTKSGKKNIVIIIAGTVGGALFFVFLVAVILWRKGYIMRKKEKVVEPELKVTDPQAGIFSLKQLEAATNNFDPSNKVGEGGFGAVYEGIMADGALIAVKQLSPKSKQGKDEFINEIRMLSALQHPNLVRLYGCCVEGEQLSLIYEYMKYNCVSRALLGTDTTTKRKITWPVRVSICTGIARGLLYLHHGITPPIIHRDIKASNVLLDANFNAKISDFGLARLFDDDVDESHIISGIAGTAYAHDSFKNWGYMAPEYVLHGLLSLRADVYSFGIVMLEIVSGKNNSYQGPNGDYGFLLDWAMKSRENGTLLDLVDPDLGSQYSSEEALTFLNVALFCSDSLRSERPSMSQTVNMLEGRIHIEDFLRDKARLAKNPENHPDRELNWQDVSETRPVINEPFTESFVIDITRAPTTDGPSTKSDVTKLSRAPINDDPNKESFVMDSVVTELPRAPMNYERHSEPSFTSRSPMINDGPYTF